MNPMLLGTPISYSRCTRCKYITLQTTTGTLTFPPHQRKTIAPNLDLRKLKHAHDTDRCNNCIPWDENNQESEA